VSWRLTRKAGRRLSWGIADQAVSSLTNFAVNIVIARELGAVQYGAFSLAYVTYGFALQASRGLATDPLLVRFSGTDVPTWRRAVASCTGTATVTGLATGICVLAAAAVLSGPARLAFLALGLTLPVLLLQDSWRFAFFALGRGGQAFLNDVVWAVALLAGLALLRETGHANVFWFVFAWGAAAGAGAAVGPLQARVLPRLSRTWEWLSRQRDLGPRYLMEGTANSAAAQLRNYGLGFILGLAALGYLQAANTLMGPFQIIMAGMGLVALPEAARLLRRSPRHMLLFNVLLSAGLTLAGLAWAVVLLIALPRGLGDWLLGPIWRPAYPLVLPTALVLMGGCAAAGAGTWMHALGAARRSVRAALVTSALYLTGALIGAVTGGTVGTLYGAALATWLGALVYWWELRLALREFGNVPPGEQYQPRRPGGRHRGGRGLSLTPSPDPDLTVPLGPVPAAAASTPARAPAPPPTSQHGTNGTTARPSAQREPARPPRPPKKPVPATRAVIVTGAAAVLTAVAATGWILVHKSPSTHKTSTGTHRTAGAPAPAAATAPTPTPVTTHASPAATLRALKPVSATPFDPYGSGPGENSDLAPRAIDASPATAWHTQWYTTARFGNLKPGTGLLLDMGHKVTISGVRLLLGRDPGADLQVRAGDRASSLTDLPPVARIDGAGGKVHMRLTTPARGRYVLIWFTRLPPDSSGTFQAMVYDVRLEGRR
jgi:O-antigen/teichoic acid export membrane protein